MTSDMFEAINNPDKVRSTVRYFGNDFKLPLSHVDICIIGGYTLVMIISSPVWVPFYLLGWFAVRTYGWRCEGDRQ